MASWTIPPTKDVYWRVESGPVFDWLVDYRERRNAIIDEMQKWAVAHGGCLAWLCLY